MQDSYFPFHSSAAVLDSEAGEIQSDVFTLIYPTVYTANFKRKGNSSWDNWFCHIYRHDLLLKDVFTDSKSAADSRYYKSSL